MSATLLVLAAGLGSRFKNGIKQLTPVGPSGELLFEYSVYDAVKAGFDKVVFVIRKDIEKDFRELCADRISSKVNVKCVFQDIEDLPSGMICPEGREKPWGTVHAVLAAREELTEPFVVVNADDYYGSGSFESIYKYITDSSRKNSENCMGGFILENTLSDSGTVTRGICSVNSTNHLMSVTETYRIGKQTDGAITGVQFGKTIDIDEKSIVSMNMWGFSPQIVSLLSEKFGHYLSTINFENKFTAEYVLPIAVDELIREDRISVNVLCSNDCWFGMTYSDDLPNVRNSFLGKIKNNDYPSPLFP